MDCTLRAEPGICSSLAALLDETRGVRVSALDGDGNPAAEEEEEEEEEEEDDEEEAAAAAGCSSLAGASP